MAVPNEGTTNLPSDAGGRYFWGVWDGNNFYAPRGDTANGLDVDVTRVQGTVTVDSELPAARLAADNLALPTAPDVLAVLMGYDGATLDMLRAGAGDAPGIAGLLNVLAMLHSPADATQNLPRSWHSSDNIPTTGVQAAGLTILDVSTGGGVRARSANVGDGAATNAILAQAGFDYNGSTLDRHRNNIEGTLLASAARTTDTNSSDQTNYNAKGVIVYLNISASGGAIDLQLNIQAKDPVSGAYRTINVATGGVTATGIYLYILYPGAVDTQGTFDAGGPLPRTWRVNVYHGNANSQTYSVGYALIN